MTSLFRDEVIHQQSAKEYGEIIIPAAFGLSFFAALTVGVMILLGLFFYYGQYTRKAHLPGIVMPSSGLIRITPKYAGSVTALRVTEGQHVSAGDTLYHLSGEHFNGQGAGTLAAMALSLKTQYSMLKSQQTLEQRENQQQQLAARQRIEALVSQISSATFRLGQAQQQSELVKQILSRYQQLAARRVVSEIEYQQKRIELSSARENVENQRQLLMQLRSNHTTTQEELNQLLTQGESRQTELARQLQGLQQQQMEIASQIHFTLTAPVSGTVAAILVHPGHSVNAHEPMMTLMPDSARLQIELYATSQNAGFLRQGQRVALRYASFPYQKFGIQYGTIRDISRVTLSPSEMSILSPMKWKESEGHYRVIVVPQHTTILAYGKQESLRPGMTLEGDVNLDTRQLWEWISEPLWSLRGKW